MVTEGRPVNGAHSAALTSQDERSSWGKNPHLPGKTREDGLRSGKTRLEDWLTAPGTTRGGYVLFGEHRFAVHPFST